jgi:hypothetical protein
MRTAHCLKLGSRENGIECAERDYVGVGLGKVEGHEGLARAHDAGDAEFEVRDGATATVDSDAVMGREIEARCVNGINFEPGVGDHVVEEFYLGGLSAGVPVFPRCGRCSR